MLFFSSLAVVPLPVWTRATVAPCFLIEKNCPKKNPIEE